MSISTSLFIGASGIETHGDAISVVGDDIANASTFGYKSARADFEEVIAGTANGQGLGDGVRFGGTETNFTQGTISTTGNPLDLAVSGGGFFAMRGNYSGIDGTYYSRDGRFHLDNTGTVVNPEGLKLQGYLIDGTGRQATTPSDLTFPATSPPRATANMALALNLDSASVPLPPFNPAAAAATSNYTTSTTAYDSLGTAHRVDIYFHDNGGGSWDWHALVDGGDLTGGVKGVATQIASGALTFNGAGALQTAVPGASSANFVGAIPNQSIAFNFGDPIAGGGTGLAGTSQFAGASNVKSLSQDGYSSGTLVDLSMAVAQDGTINATYSNGQTRPAARLALATFASDAGLHRDGSQLFSSTVASGQALLDAAATGNRGTVSGGALETSNVDLGHELVTLIAYQRAFSANARTVTTSNEMLTEVANLGR